MVAGHAGGGRGGGAIVERIFPLANKCAFFVSTSG